MRLEMAVNGVAATDFGRLSSQNLVTGSDGRATAVYTAPPAPPDLNDPEPIVSFVVTPIGTNFDNQWSRFVSIRLVRQAVAQIPGAPFPEFTYTPANPRVGTLVQFDAQYSSDPGGFIVSYQWDWGDGEQETGITQNHDFFAAATYQVTLTVTDNSGLRASRTRSITVQ
jgi:PKD repeat protein